MSDVSYVLRLLIKSPGFTSIALLVFSVGIGTTTAILSVADALVLRALPVPRAERVMTIWQYNRDTGAGYGDVAPGNALDWIKRSRSFEALAIAEPFSFTATLTDREPELLPAAFVSEHFFDVLGTPMFLGRVFRREDHGRGAGRVAILGHGLWRDRFGGDTSVVGRAVRLDNGAPYSIVGVMPANLELRPFDNRFSRPEPHIWLPKPGFSEFEPNLRGAGFWNVIGRLAPGVSIAQASAELEGVSVQLAREFPQTNRSIAAQVVPLRTHLIGSLRQVLPLLVGAAVMLLLVASANVASLLLARGVERGREFAVRQALGAGRGRLITQMLLESLVLASMGGVMGLVLSRWTLDLIARLRPVDVAHLDRIPIDVRAAAIACGVTIVAALLAGVMPALQLSRPGRASAFKDGRVSPRRGARNTVVIVEVAAAMLLSVGAGLLVRSFVLVQRVDPGFSANHVSVLQMFASPRLDTPGKRSVFAQQVLDRVRSLPGVVAVGGVTAMPFGDAKVLIRGPLTIAGRPPGSSEESQIYMTAVAGDYFQAMGVPLIQGRLFDAADVGASRRVVLVSQSAAQQFWPDGSAVGAQIRFRFTGTIYDAEVVGVVGDLRHEALDRPAAAELFLPYALSGFRAFTLAVRTQPASPATLPVLKEQIWAIDPTQAIAHAATLDELVARSLGDRRFSLFLLGGFALGALGLACAGVYGVISVTTTQRTREFGVRMALGARRGHIAALVLRDGLTLAAIGVAAGSALALPLTRVLRSLLFEVSPLDPMTFALVGLMVVVVAAVACYLPASRAMAVDPVKALRVD